MSSNLNIRVTQAAENDLLHLFQYGAEQWGSEQPTRYGEQIDRAFLRLAQYPELGMRLEGRFDVFRRLAVGSHTIYYRIAGNEILVVRVLHQSVDIDQLMPGSAEN